MSPGLVWGVGGTPLRRVEVKSGVRGEGNCQVPAFHLFMMTVLTSCHGNKGYLLFAICGGGGGRPSIMLFKSQNCQNAMFV